MIHQYWTLSVEQITEVSALWATALIKRYNDTFGHRFRPVALDRPWVSGHGHDYTFCETRPFNVSRDGGRPIGSNGLLYRILIGNEIWVLKMMWSFSGGTVPSLARFEKESSIPNMLNPHANIIPILHSWTGPCPDQLLDDIKRKTDLPFASRTSFFVMPNMQCDLSEYQRRWVEEKRVISELTWCTMVFDLLAAVARLEEKHVVHRDIKPANIFVDQTGALVLGDFGSAHCIMLPDGQALTVAMNSDWCEGTPLHQAPEVLDRCILANKPPITITWQELLGKSDAWQIGLVLKGLFLNLDEPWTTEQEHKSPSASMDPPPECPFSIWPIIQGLLRPDPRTRLSGTQAWHAASIAYLMSPYERPRPRWSMRPMALDAIVTLCMLRLAAVSTRSSRRTNWISRSWLFLGQVTPSQLYRALRLIESTTFKAEHLPNGNKKKNFFFSLHYAIDAFLTFCLLAYLCTISVSASPFRNTARRNIWTFVGY